LKAFFEAIFINALTAKTPRRQGIERPEISYMMLKYFAASDKNPHYLSPD
jgi:hypothetical protein